MRNKTEQSESSFFCPGSKMAPNYRLATGQGNVRSSLRVSRVLAEELPSQPKTLVWRRQVVMVLLLRCCRGRLGSLLLRLRGAEIRVPDQGVDIDPLVLAVSQALSDEDFGSVRNGRLVGKVDLSGLENGVLLQDGGLRLVVAKGLKN